MPFPGVQCTRYAVGGIMVQGTQWENGWYYGTRYAMGGIMVNLFDKLLYYAMKTNCDVGPTQCNLL